MSAIDADKLEKLLPCPFCKSGQTQIRPQYMWTGKRNQLISATVMHWCNRNEGQLQSSVQMKGKTIEEATALWNTRHQPPEPKGDL